MSMANDFDEHLTVIYSFIDELRDYTRQLKREHVESVKRIDQNDKQIAQLTEMQAKVLDTQSMMVDTMAKISESHNRPSESHDRLVAQHDRQMETQGITIKILRGMEAKLDNHEERLSAANI